MRLKQSIRSKINASLYDICRERRQFVPLGDVQRVLRNHGMDFEDVILCGREGRATLDLTSGDEPVDNAMLVVHWSKGNYDGRYESTIYVS